MAVTISLAGQLRDGSVTPKALRRAQLVPGIVYGRSYAPKAVQFEYLPLSRVVLQAGTSHMVFLAIAGEADTQRVLVREVQRDPVTSRILHVDLMAVAAGQRLRSEVPLVQRGESPAEGMGGILVQLLESVEVECMPDDMPEAVGIDITRLTTLHSHLTLADLEIPSSVTVLTPLTTEVIQVSVPRGLIEEEAAEEEEAAAERAAEVELRAVSEEED